MMLEEKISKLVEKYCPDMSEVDKIVMVSFLTSECWNIINEEVREYLKQAIKGTKRPITH